MKSPFLFGLDYLFLVLLFTHQNTRGMSTLSENLVIDVNCYALNDAFGSKFLRVNVSAGRARTEKGGAEDMSRVSGIHFRCT